jgi:hypothetical protein
VRGEMHSRIGWEILREREKLEDLGVDKRIILEQMFKKWDGGVG